MTNNNFSLTWKESWDIVIIYQLLSLTDWIIDIDSIDKKQQAEEVINEFVVVERIFSKAQVIKQILSDYPDILEKYISEIKLLHEKNNHKSLSRTINTFFRSDDNIWEIDDVFALKYIKEFVKWYFSQLYNSKEEKSLDKYSYEDLNQYVIVQTLWLKDEKLYSFIIRLSSILSSIVIKNDFDRKEYFTVVNDMIEESFWQESNFYKEVLYHFSAILISELLESKKKFSSSKKSTWHELLYNVFVIDFENIVKRAIWNTTWYLYDKIKEFNFLKNDVICELKKVWQILSWDLNPEKNEDDLWEISLPEELQKITLEWLEWVLEILRK